MKTECAVRIAAGDENDSAFAEKVPVLVGNETSFTGLGTKICLQNRGKKHRKIRKNNACNGFLGVVG